MSTVETVRGPIDTADLGPTLMHEHIFVMQPEAYLNYGHVWGESYWDEDVRVDDAIEKLRAVREAGIATIVDPTAPGLGRNIPRIQRINRDVDLNIVVATGVYAFLELPNFLGYRSVEAITELFVREIREGIDDTGVKAAFLKCCVERHGIIGDVPRILEAVAAAAIETGAPVMVHTNAPRRPGCSRWSALTEAGVDPTQIVIAHAGDSNDLEYLRAIADTGAALGFDRFNIPFFNPDEQRIETLVALAGRGVRATASTSATTPRASTTSWSATRTSPTRSPTTSTSDRTILPALLEAGVDQAQIDEMMIANARRYFEPLGG